MGNDQINSPAIRDFRFNPKPTMNANAVAIAIWLEGYERSREGGTKLSSSNTKWFGSCREGLNLYGGIGLPIKGLIYSTKIAITTIATKKIIPIFRVRRTKVRIVATTTKLKTSPNDVVTIIIASTLPLVCIDLKYVVIKLSKHEVRCEATNVVSITKMITNTINCIDLISIIHVGHRLDNDNDNNWS